MQTGSAANEPILPPTYSALMNEGKTLYLKVSYLLRFQTATELQC
jgi:hypothetical protein